MVAVMQTVYLAAQRKSQALGESVQGFTVEAGKLSQRLASAETQYLDGLRRVKATNRQLQSLAKEIASSENGAQRKPHCRPLCCLCIISLVGARHVTRCLHGYHFNWHLAWRRFEFTLCSDATTTHNSVHIVAAPWPSTKIYCILQA